ncbi:MAG: flagellar export chaperone FliS [Oscillospiraceae bacterium]|nr:flagellar export chaperone FliS [Oscillospiraceae bacterium]
MQPIPINQSPQDAYKRQDVLTATPTDLIVMLYDALKKNIVLGRRGIEKKKVETAHKHLIKAQEIVTELVNSLDMNYEISEELLAIYEFILACLEDANFQKNVEILDPVVEIVDDLRSAWYEISQSNKGNLYINEGQG